MSVESRESSSPILANIAAVLLASYKKSEKSDVTKIVETPEIHESAVRMRMADGCNIDARAKRILVGHSISGIWSKCQMLQ